MGLWTLRDDRSDSLRFREAVVSPETFTAVPPASGRTNNTVQNAIYRRFSLGDYGGGVTRDPGLFPNAPLETNLRTFNPATGQWFDEPVSLENRLHTVSSTAHEQTKSWALARQSFLWEDRVVVTAGWRTIATTTPPTSTGQSIPPRDSATPPRLIPVGPRFQLADLRIVNDHAVALIAANLTTRPAATRVAQK